MGLKRRAFLRRTLLATAAVALDPLDGALLDAQPGNLRSTGPRKRVIILGAGMAGLTAAYELRQAGHQVLVLEARLRPGGRIETLRDRFAEGLYAEGSAARIPGHHELTHRFVEMLGLPLAPFQPDTPSLFYLEGETHRGDANDLLAEAGLTAEEQRLGVSGIQRRYLGPLVDKLGDITAEGWPPEALLRYDRISATRLLREQGLSESAIRFFDAGLGFFDELSGLELLMQIPNAFGPKQRIVGGMDRLPRALAAKLTPNIRYGHPVVRIEQTEGSATAVVERAESHERVRGDYLICTIPFSVLRDVEIVPEVSPGKRRAIDGLAYESVTRVFVQTSERFWKARGLSGFALTDHPMEIWDASYGQPGGRGLLMAYMRSHLARKAAAMDPADRIAFATDAIADVFPDVHPHFEGGTSLVWDDDEWTRGAYTTYHPGQIGRFYQAMKRPEGRIYFAGEHISPWPAWIQGAVHSGMRAASKLNARQD